jgi:hypothetical protein
MVLDMLASFDCQARLGEVLSLEDASDPSRHWAFHKMIGPHGLRKPISQYRHYVVGEFSRFGFEEMFEERMRRAWGICKETLEFSGVSPFAGKMIEAQKGFDGKWNRFSAV